MKVIFYHDKMGEWRWRAIAPNGRIIADCGEGYERLRDCKRGFAAFCRYVRIGRVKEVDNV